MQDEKFIKDFITSVIGDKLVFFCNGKDKIEEVKSSLLSIGVKEDTSNIDAVYPEYSQGINKLINKFYAYANAFFQELLKINNFSFLVGTGTSIPFGSKSIRDISKLDFKLQRDQEKLYENLKKIFLEISEKKDFETFLSFLFSIKISLLYKDRIFDFKIEKIEDISALIEEIKRRFVDEFCNLPYEDKIIGCYPRDNLFKIHQEFVRKILVRPFPLRRPNIFTLNYDLMFEKAMDKMGVAYVDGFMGTTERIFKPESFDFDFYYPATTTEGKVTRLERVVHFYKLHGSIDWVRVKRTPYNVMGILKKSPDILNSGDFSNLLIYPTPMKEGETIGFPYSEVLRRFANIIQQPQSVLITLGYSFGDEHINRIIYEAFSIPSFNLIIIGHTKKSIEEIQKRIGKDDERVTYIGGELFGDFKNFVEKMLPTASQMELEEKITKKLNMFFPAQIEERQENALNGDHDER